MKEKYLAHSTRALVYALSGAVGIGLAVCAVFLVQLFSPTVVQAAGGCSADVADCAVDGNGNFVGYNNPWPPGCIYIIPGLPANQSGGLFGGKRPAYNPSDRTGSTTAPVCRPSPVPPFRITYYERGHRMYQTGTYIDRTGCANKYRADGTFLRRECFNEAGQEGTTDTTGELNGTVGWIDKVSTAGLGGWAYDANDVPRSVLIHIYRDGKAGAGGVLVGYGSANIPRQDINDLFQITGNHGFDFAVPGVLCDGKPHTIYAYAIDTANNGKDNLMLGGSGKSLTCTSAPAPTAGQQQLTLSGTSGSGGGGAAAGLVGFLDSATCKSFAGWALDQANPAFRLTVQFYADGLIGAAGAKYLGSATTTLQRDDVNNVYTVTGTHGFNFSVPNGSFAAGESHRVYAYAIGAENKLLTGSPKSFTCTTADIAANRENAASDALAQNNGPSTFIISYPTAGVEVVGTSVTVSFYSTVEILSTDYAVLKLDSQLPIIVRQSGGSYTLTNVAPGSHTLQAYLAHSDGTKINNTSTTVTFTTR